MRLAFKDYEIRRICEDSDIAINRYGIAVAEMLKIRLADLEAAVTISDLVSGNPNVVPNSPYPFYKIDLDKGLKLLFRADHTKQAPKNALGEINWAVVNYIQVLKIQ